MEWISIKDRQPKEPGFYKVKTNLDELPIIHTFYTRTLGGELKWLTYTDSIKITHWEEKK